MNKLQDLLQKDNCYSIGIRKRNPAKGLLMDGNDDAFHILPISDKEWYADPIVFSYHGKDYLFCEVFDRKKDIGNIGCTVIDGVEIKKPEIVMSIGSHLSYPCVFEIDDTVYMIPKTTTRLDVELFRATEFPYKWERVCALISNGEFADSTYYRDENGRCSLLLAFEQFEGNGSITKTRVFNANRIAEGNLEELTDVKFEFSDHSRGAGKLFKDQNGRLCRAAQICTPEYGYALEILQISTGENEYQEKSIAKVYPQGIKTDLDKEVIGIHTYALTDQYEIIDVKFDDPRLKYQIRRVWRYVKRKVAGEN